MFHVTIDVRPVFRKEDSGRRFNKHISSLAESLLEVKQQVADLHLEGYTSFQITIDKSTKRMADDYELYIKQDSLELVSPATKERLHQKSNMDGILEEVKR